MFGKLPFRLLVRELRRLGFSPTLDADGDVAGVEIVVSPELGAVKFHFADNGGYVAGIAELPPRPAPADRQAILQLLALANRGILVGRYDMDLADGELRFFAAFPSRAFLLQPKSETGKALALLGSMVEMLAPAAMAVMTGLRTPLEAYVSTESGKRWREASPGLMQATEAGIAAISMSQQRDDAKSETGRSSAPARSDSNRSPAALELVKDYSLAPLNVRGIIPLAKIETAVANYLSALDAAPGETPLPDRPHMNILLSGPPGTGKSEFVRYLGRKFDLPVVVRTAGDLLDKYVGNTEKFIREAFAEASKTRSILFLDEFDGILHNREDATQGWQLSHTNEILRAMEDFQGVVVAATNLAERLDPAVMRRFTYKLEFGYLTSEGKEMFFKRAFSSELTEEEKTRLNAIPDLAPGDFKTASQGLYYLGEEVTNELRLDALAREADFKNRNRKAWTAGKERRIGFAVQLANKQERTEKQ